jgi:hypothetical protein
MDVRKNANRAQKNGQKGGTNSIFERMSKVSMTLMSCLCFLEKHYPYLDMYSQWCQ